MNRPALRTPVTLLTGFLGSGKTTLLAQLLRRPDMRDTAVIVNEFGEIGLDHALLTPGSETAVLLDSGCLCCTVNDSLGATLADLHFRKVRGELPPFRRVMVETTGLADPAPILHALMTDPLASRHFALDGIVVTVDGVHGSGQLDTAPEALKQAALADRLLVTKTDIAPAAGLVRLESRLQALNPGVPINRIAHGEAEPGMILDIGLFDAASREVAVERWLRDEAVAHAGHDHRHGADRHDSRIRAVCRYLDFPVSWPGYAAWVDVMRRLPAENLMRVKGLMRLGPRAEPHVIQGVQHLFDEPLRLDRWPLAEPRGRLVIIGRDIDDGVMERSLAALRAE